MTSVGHAVEVEVEHRQRLQTLDEAVGVVVEDHTLVQQSLGIEDGLQLTHGLVGLVLPFVLHKRCHVATCAVFGLQRAVIVFNDKLGHGAHHLGIARHLMFIGEALVQDEVVVTLEGMAVDAGVVVAVVSDELLQLHGSLGQ